MPVRAFGCPFVAVCLAILLRLAHRIYPVEPVDKMGDMLRGDPWAVVFDPQQSPASATYLAAAGIDPYPAFVPGPILDGVLDQVGRHLAQVETVAAQPDRGHLTGADRYPIAL